MILRLDELALDLPAPKNPSANDAAAVQELLGGKYGEMSTLMNYTFQSFNFRGRDRLRPFYSLTAAIAAEEYSHIEAVSYAINLLLTGVSRRNPDPAAAPLAGAADARNTYHFIASGQSSLPIDSMGRPWTGDNVFSSGNLRLDLLHNFFLECGARANKMRVYEMVTDPCARTMVGYLLVRGGLHVYAYAMALEKLTGVDVKKLMPIPTLSNAKFPEARAFMKHGLHRELYTFSPNAYMEAGLIWNGTHPEDGSELVVIPGAKKGVPYPVLEEEPQLNAPGEDDGFDPEMFGDMAKKLGLEKELRNYH
ncbi:manganese catalase [Hymenobacter sedentarius]|uniref:Manganese catalase n=1 Tax=Hymenobacter sedentarius TaxID=1411621 RepID=A0A0U3K325_9BACT|nr:manganese catalase family protein [Hymenobacter sedentarius]ALW87007.1 manganese catalase [Hymenobacter sedentarius]